MRLNNKIFPAFVLILILTAAGCSQVSDNQDTLSEPSENEAVEADSQTVVNDIPADVESETAEPIESAESETGSTENSQVVQTTEPVQPVSSGPKGIDPSVISIPTIDVRADIEDVGILENGQMGVPDDGDTVGWFHRGPKPGAAGNSVMAGHVDDRSGPAIFFDLDQLTLGDRIYIEDDEGTELAFEVTRMEVYPYDDAPMDLIFGPTATQRLNLITCTGEFDRNAGTHRERLVVFTELVTDQEL